MVITLIGIFSLSFIAYKMWHGDKTPMRKYFWAALIIKILAGFSVGLIYTYYYQGGDTFQFHKDSLPVSQLASEDLGAYFDFLFSSTNEVEGKRLILSQHRSIFFVKTLSIINLVTNNSYWLGTIYMSFFAFVGSWLLSRELARSFPLKSNIVALSFMFFPSVLFWSSGILKESLAIGCLFLLSYYVLKMWNGRRVRLLDLIVMAIATWILWRLKYFYAAVYIPVVLSVFLARFISNRFRIKSGWIQSGIWMLIFCALGYLATWVHINFHLDRLAHVIIQNHDELIAASNDSNVIHFYELNEDPLSILNNVPLAIWSGLYRPLIWEADNLVKGITGLENLLLLISTIVLLITGQFRKINPAYRLIALGTIAYIILLSMLLSLSTPNLGTLARYKTGYLPFLVFLLFGGNHLILRLEWLYRRISQRLVK